MQSRSVQYRSLGNIEMTHSRVLYSIYSTATTTTTTICPPWLAECEYNLVSSTNNHTYPPSKKAADITYHYLSIYRSTHLSIYLSIYQFIYVYSVALT